MTYRSLFLSVTLLMSLTAASQTQLVVLGTAQDGGYPQMGCNKVCCEATHQHESLKQFVVSLALADYKTKQWWLFEATPDIKNQLQLFAEATQHQFTFLPSGIFISHAHMGHYTGLAQLGREVMNTNHIPVYALPRLASFLQTNGPWSQLVSAQNITLTVLAEEKSIALTENISITPLSVPHRDEYSETAGFKIITSEKSYLFIPDIDKWSKWHRNIVDEVKRVDEAYLDATFFSADELPGRSMSEVPHPLVIETMRLFQNESLKTKNKITLIHFNHTNPLLYDTAKQEWVTGQGFRIARQVENTLK